MLIQGNQLEELGVGSIRSGGRIGRVQKLIINPHNLHIDALSCKIVGQSREQLIAPEDIRDIGPRGVVVNDHDQLINHQDAIRLQPIIKINFSLNNLQAFVGKKRVGAVENFAVEKESLFVQKIYVRPTLLNRWSTSQLVFDRSQIEEVTKSRIVFRDSSAEKSLIKQRSGVKQAITQPSFSASLTEE